MKKISIILLSIATLLSFNVQSNSIKDWNTKKKYQFTTHWFDQDRADDRTKFLKNFSGKDNVKYLEIGVWEGRSFFWLMDNILTHKTSKAYALDIFRDPKIYNRFLKNLKASTFSDRVTILKGRSDSLLPSLKPRSFDIIYIDGAHSSKEVIKDLVFSWRLLKESGILILDDYELHKNRFPHKFTPKPAIDFFLTTFSDSIELLKKYSKSVYLKKKRVKDLNGCYSCSIFSKYIYEWYSKRLFEEDKKKFSLNEVQTNQLESKIRAFENETRPKRKQKLKNEAIKFVEQLSKER